MRGRAQRLPCNANQVLTAFGKTQGCVVLVAGFVGCLAGYQCKASIDSIWGKRLVAWFVCCWWDTHPFFFTLLPLVGVSVGSACLACWLLGFGENTYSDGWIMDRSKKCNFLVRWLLGLLAVIQCLMNMQLFCLCAWLMAGWMDGCCVDKGGTGCGGGRSAFPAMQTKYRQHLGETELRGLVAWFVGCLLV